jgi:hypothetical protein
MMEVDAGELLGVAPCTEGMSWTQGKPGTMPVHPIMQENARLRQELAALRQGVGTMGSLPGIVDFSVDNAGLVSAWGREAERVFGRSAKDIVGRSLVSTIAFTNAGQVKLLGPDPMTEAESLPPLCRTSADAAHRELQSWSSRTSSAFRILGKGMTLAEKCCWIRSRVRYKASVHLGRPRLWSSLQDVQMGD